MAAGTPIGCNTCHSIATSCRNSPVGSQCGKPSETTTPSTNQAPVFTEAPPIITVEPGKIVPYSYTPKASDPEGNELTYSISGRLDQMSIDAKTGTVSTPNWDGIKLPVVLPYTFNYVIAVKDGKGGMASQTVPVTFDCPSGQVLGFDPLQGAKGCVSNHQPSIAAFPLASAVVGQAYNFSVLAIDADLQKAYYNLTGAPSGMTIGQTSGVIKWTPSNKSSVNFTLNAEDRVGGHVSKPLSLHVCDAGQTWQDDTAGCIANHAPVITSGQTVGGVDVGGNYSEQITATDEDGNNLSYTLYGAPVGMTVSSNGSINWTATIVNSSPGFGFSVAVDDGKGGISVQPLSIVVCPAGHPYDPNMWMCM